MTPISLRLRALSLLSLLALLLAACGAGQTVQPTQAPAAPTQAPAASTQAPVADAQPLRVVATYSILGDLVQNVAGDLVDLTVLVGPGGDAHTYEPTPRDSATLAEADILFENGLEFEGWIDDLYAAAGSQATRVVASENITPLAAPEGGHSHDHEDPLAHACEHFADAPEQVAAGATIPEDHTHYVVTLTGGAGEVTLTRGEDAEISFFLGADVPFIVTAGGAANAATYEAHTIAYLAELEELDTFVQQQVAALAAEQRKLVTTHDTFGYFAERYGFEVVGTALGSLSTEAADPSAGELAELVEEIRAAGVPAIFAENVSNPALMATIAREAGVELAPTLFTDALGEPGSVAATYLDMVRHNVTTIVEALGS